MGIDEPWRAIPPRIGELIRPQVPALSDEIIEAIRERVPAYRRPLRGRFGVGIRGGVAEALAQFVDLVTDPELDRSGGDAVYRALGRGEYRERRSLDALLAAYRLGARVAWTRVSAIAIEAGVDRRTLALLAEAVFAYIDELSALSADGYAQAQSAAAGESERMRRRVAALLLDPDIDEAAVRAAATDAGWDPPERIAALAWAGGGRRLRSRLPAGTLIAEPGDDGGAGLALLADPDAPGLGARLSRAASQTPVVLGPTFDLMSARRSAERARETLRLIEAGVISAAGFTLADDHLGALVAHGDERILAELAQRRLAPLDEETPASRIRLTETLRSWLDHQGEVAQVAAELHVHPQTVRYRLSRLRERFGDLLEDPDARFELALALRGVAEPRRR
ncbi:MAG TPA: helix-turn-helix domain-containing protein [Solirubrobacterales bacterium]